MSNTTKIYKSSNDENFTMISNDFIRNKDLLMQEKFLLIFILSHQKGFIMSRQQFYNSLPDSKGSIDKAHKGLVSKGFIKGTKLKNNKGQFIGWHYEIYENPLKNVERYGLLICKNRLEIGLITNKNTNTK